jgi:hypothetical protein
MRKLSTLVLFTVLFCAGFTACSNDKYDDTELRNEISDLANRVSKLEAQVQTINNSISSLQGLYEALNSHLYIKEVGTNSEGTTIVFSDGSKTTIKNGTNGANGKNGVDGTTPIINAALYSGAYYWTQTVNGQTNWLTDSNGNKIPTTGTNGKTPVMKVSDAGYWMISYDGGASYSYVKDLSGNMVKAIGTNGTNGTNGINGTNGKDAESFFESVAMQNGQLVLTLVDGTIISLPLDNATVVKSHAKVDLGLSVYWATMNVGAETVTSVGTYCLWGDGTGTRDWDNGDMKYSMDKSSYNISGTERDLSHTKWGNGWRTPTYAEFLELAQYTQKSLKTINGVKCVRFTANNNNYIDFPINGAQYINGWSSSTGFSVKYLGAGTNCYYLTSSANEFDTQTEYLYTKIFNYSTSTMGYSFVSFLAGSLKAGVRPVKDK